MDPVITVSDLGKKYLLRHQTRERYTALRDVLAHSAGRLTRRLLDPLSPRRDDPAREEFWALHDISFNVQRGDRVGIIGRNGAGKSTLLKIISRITEPTVGRIEIEGRVASLLEVGTGFHPELTGRENIFLNGVILGMRRAEIRKRFDEIVAFAEVERFLDTPVKRYSSGMYVRLAFAVAAHLEPEILIVDEVLSVGDARFQRKCMGKMEHVGKEGRTVLFVSHNMNAIRRLCNKAILLHQGEVVAHGTAEDVCEQYLQMSRDVAEQNTLERQLAQLPVDPTFRLIHAGLRQSGRPAGMTVRNGESLEVRVRYEVKEPVRGLRVFVDVRDEVGTLIFRSFHDEAHEDIPEMAPGEYESVLEIPPGIFAPRDYVIAVQSGIHNKRYCLPEEGVSFPISVVQTSDYNRAYSGDAIRGQLALVLKWKTARSGGAQAP